MRSKVVTTLDFKDATNCPRRLPLPLFPVNKNVHSSTCLFATFDSPPPVNLIDKIHVHARICLVSVEIEHVLIAQSLACPVQRTLFAILYLYFLFAQACFSPQFISEYEWTQFQSDKHCPSFSQGCNLPFNLLMALCVTHWKVLVLESVHFINRRDFYPVGDGPDLGV